MELEAGLTDYSFEIRAEKRGRFSVKRERFISNSARFEVKDGVLVSETGARSIEKDRLALPALSGFSEFRPAYDEMAKFRFYAPVSDKIRQVQEPDQGETLQPDGGNSAAILREIRRRDAAKYDRVRKYLAQIAPNVKEVDYAKAGPKETIAFYQDVGAASPWEFGAISMSDGTLRVLGVLLAVFQMNTPTLTVIEEPEATVHPAALEVLLDLLLEGSELSQMIVTTHSPELLNHKSVDDDAIRVVHSDRGKTRIGPMSGGAKRVLAARLASPGEMLAPERIGNRPRADARCQSVRVGESGMIVPVVEGQGEEQSVRIVLERMMADFERYVEIDRPFRVKRDKIVQPSELERCIDRILSGRENVSAVLLLLDADDDCPKERGAELQARGQTHIGNRGYFGVVLANREFEAWFLADLEGLSVGN